MLQSAVSLGAAPSTDRATCVNLEPDGEMDGTESNDRTGALDGPNTAPTAGLYRRRGLLVCAGTGIITLTSRSAFASRCGVSGAGSMNPSLGEDRCTGHTPAWWAAHTAVWPPGFFAVAGTAAVPPNAGPATKWSDVFGAL